MMRNAMMKMAACLACAMLLAAATGVRGSTFEAWSGNTCDGDAGGIAQCDGSCHSFQTRHSFKVSGASRCVTLFQDSGCPSTKTKFYYKNQSGGCQNVNTGTGVLSFLCSTSTTCLS